MATMRIQLSPATTRWIMGDRYGDVVSGPHKARTGGTYYMVHMDKSGRTIKVFDHAIYEWID